MDFNISAPCFCGRNSGKIEFWTTKKTKKTENFNNGKHENKRKIRTILVWNPPKTGCQHSLWREPAPTEVDICPPTDIRQCADKRDSVHRKTCRQSAVCRPSVRRLPVVRVPTKCLFVRRLPTARRRFADAETAVCRRCVGCVPFIVQKLGLCACAICKQSVGR